MRRDPPLTDTHPLILVLKCLKNKGLCVILFVFCLWQPFCKERVMILMTIRMKVLAEKHKELSQTISSLAGFIRAEQGCKRCDFCRNTEDDNDLLLLEQWDSEESLQAHMKSDRFRILQGTANLLQEPCEVMLHLDFHPEGAIKM